MARRHVTVVLSGDGGDEAFGGYGFRYAPHAVESIVRGSSRHARARGRGVARHALAPFAAHAACAPLGHPARKRRARSGRRLLLRSVRGEAARRARLLGLAPLRDLSESGVYDAVTAPYRRCSSTSPMQRAQYADLKIYLANDVLVKVDRMTMQHSIEVRCPLLDHRLIELAFRIPTAQKMPWLRSKHLLRQLARRRLPREIGPLPKRGFSAPISEWIAGPCAAMFEHDVCRRGARVEGLIDTAYVRHLFDAHRSGGANHGQALWTVWMLARWFERTAISDAPMSQTRVLAAV